MWVPRPRGPVEPGEPQGCASTAPPGRFAVLDPATGAPTFAFDPFPNDPERKGVFAVSAVEMNGRWTLSLSVTGTADARDVGAFEFPITVQDSTREPRATWRTFMLRLDVVVAPDDKYRAAFEHNIDPADFAVNTVPPIQPIVLGGKVEWETYGGQYCLGLDAAQICGPVSDFVGVDGNRLMFPFARLAPNGLDAGRHEVRAWLPVEDDDERAYPEPFVVTFFMLTGPPEITDLRWNAATGQASLAVRPYSTIDAPDRVVPIKSVTCRLDGQPVDCFGPQGGAWTPTGLTPGAHTLAVTVTGENGNYDTRTLSFTALPTFNTGPTAAITGSPVVGQTLTATEGSPSPAADSYTYQWSANGTPIAGATGRTLTLTPAQQGTAITVTVTAIRAGYVSATSTSPPTAVVTAPPATKQSSRTIAVKAFFGVLVIVTGTAGVPPTGTVTLLRGSTTLATQRVAGGVAFFPRTSFGGSTANLRVTYSGDATYLPSSG